MHSSSEFMSKYEKLSDSMSDMNYIIENEWDDALPLYENKVVEVKRTEGLHFDVYDDWKNGEEYLGWNITELLTVSETDWRTILYVKIESNNCVRYVKFSHSSLIIQCVSMNQQDWNLILSQTVPCRRVLAYVECNKGNNTSLETLLKRSIAHWHSKNGDDFTDFLMFSIFGKNYLNYTYDKTID